MEDSNENHLLRRKSKEACSKVDNLSRTHRQFVEAPWPDSLGNQMCILHMRHRPNLNI